MKSKPITVKLFTKIKELRDENAPYPFARVTIGEEHGDLTPEQAVKLGNMLVDLYDEVYESCWSDVPPEGKGWKRVGDEWQRLAPKYQWLTK